jgi:ABC-type nitrate/sulfonate/bicarbonate transport system substrate-binding protein
MMHSIKFFLFSLVLMAGSVVASADAVRLGWQTPWATQGQLVMALKHSNIPQVAGVDLEYVGFSYGGPLNKAALGGEVDVLLTADQPAMVLISRNPDFRIVSRMMYNRVCIYVPPSSGIGKLVDLKGKTVMGPIGAAAERVALAAMEQAGIGSDEIMIGQLDMAQQSALLTREQSSDGWPGIDALFGFDPLPAVFEEQGKARMLECGKVVSVVVAHRRMLEQRRTELERFLKAFKMSWVAFSNHPGVLNRLFSRESRLDVSDKVLDDAASIEPNRWVKTLDEMSFDFSEEDFETFEHSNRFLLAKGILNEPLDMTSAMDLDITRSNASRPSDAELASISIQSDTE